MNNKGSEALELLFDLLCEREHTNSEHNFWLKLYQEVREDLKAYSKLKSSKNIIEKELKALVVLKDLFDFDFALRFPSNQPMLRIENKRTNEYWEIPVTQEKSGLLKEVLK